MYKVYALNTTRQSSEKSKNTFKNREINHVHGSEGIPSQLSRKELACNIGDPGSIPGQERAPGGGHGNPVQYSCLENPHGQRSLVGYRPQGHKESDMTEWLSTHTDLSCFLLQIFIAINFYLELLLLPSISFDMYFNFFRIFFFAFSFDFFFDYWLFSQLHFA